MPAMTHIVIAFASGAATIPCSKLAKSKAPAAAWLCNGTVRPNHRSGILVRKQQRHVNRSTWLTMSTASEDRKHVPHDTKQANLSRRDILAAGIAGIGGLSAAAFSAHAAAEPTATAPATTTSVVGATSSSSTTTTTTTSPPELVEYRGPISLGFSFAYPAKDWSVKKKPIKTHMSELLLTKSNGPATTSAGVTVDAVKINDITEFGSPQDVGDKVVNVEKRKDNVLNATLLSARQMEAEDLIYYTIEYAVESGRGSKKYIAKATITGGNLYVFTVQAKHPDFDGNDGAVLAAMVDSFQVKRQYL
jgi:PsbP